MKVIALVGMPGSGKGTCTDYLGEKYDWPVIHFGNMMYEEVQRRGLDNVKDEVFVREDMRRLEGKAVFAKHAARKTHELEAQGTKVVVFDGLYSWSEYKFLQGEFGKNLLVIATAAPKKMRYDRVLNRKDNHRQYTLEQLIVREEAEVENLEKGGPIASADYTIVNDSSTEAMLGKLDAIVGDFVAS